MCATFSVFLLRSCKIVEKYIEPQTNVNFQSVDSRLPNARMLNIWLNIKKQLLFEETDQKSGNVMQQPMDSCVCGINTSSESILIRSYLLFAR